MKLRTLIILLIIVVTATIGIISSTLAGRLVSTALQQSLEAEAVSIGATLSEPIAYNVIEGEILPTREILLNLVHQVEDVKFIFVIDFNGNVFAHTFDEGLPQGLLEHTGDPIQTSSPELSRYSTQEGPLVAISYPLIEGMTASVHIGIDESPTIQQVQTIRRQIFIVSLVIGSIGILFAAAISYNVIHPLGLLTNFMRTYGKENEYHKINIDASTWEINELLKSFNQMLVERKQAETAIYLLNEKLEERVRLRTMELENANRELDTFAYSVSHDLRAPLRAIIGFSQALLEDYEDLLDEDGQEFLHEIIKSGKRMNRLIQDLLMLSRVTRSDINHSEVNLSETAQSVLEELQNRDKQRQVKFLLEGNITARVDERLLKIALDNLLGNAWKFTGKTDDARIEFCTMEQDNQIVYVVKDNGAGFDVAHMDKLFGAFQRLHRYDEFEGTGIGLATVQRIIHKHGGRVWADARVDHGANFYFTLPGNIRED